MNSKLYILDAYALIFRAYYAMIRNPQSTSTGIETSAVFGFVNTLQDLLRHHAPTHIAVCFDPGGPTFRHEAYPEYKANRDKTPEGILVAVPYIKRILEAYHIPVVTVEGFEADDVIGSLARLAEQVGMPTFMVTGDKDFAQLVTPLIKIYNPSKGETLGVDEVNAKYGLTSPLQVIDLLGLMGDAADNIPGCPGVGPKTAEKLIQQFGSVENLLQHTDQLTGKLRTRVEENAEQIRTSKWLATIKTDVPLTFEPDVYRRRHADLDALRAVFNELEFRTLARRIIDQGEANIGLDPKEKEPEPGHAVPAFSEAMPRKTQPTLFDEEEPAPENATVVPAYSEAMPRKTQPTLFDEEEPAPESAPVVSAYSEAKPRIAIKETRIIADSYAVEQLIARLSNATEVAVYPIADGEQAMRASLVGIALAAADIEPAYLPLDAMGFMLQALAPLFTSEATLVCPDVKRLIVMLHTRGVKFTAPYYDTAVAHYILQPERPHDTAAIALELLQYNQLPLPTPKSKKSAFSSLPHPTLARFAGETAQLSLALRPALDARLEQEQLSHLLRDLEHPLIPVLADMEIAGVRIDVAALHDYSRTLAEQVAQLDRECQSLAGVPFNTASPAQVGEILFDRLALDSKAKKTRTGQYSTTEEILLRLRDRHPIVGKILDLRGKRKLLSTYVTALPELINPTTGRIHTTFNQTVTATGRLSSANPNLQNIPVRTDEGREIRRAFIPSEGNIFFSADYSQIELRLVADLSADPTMLDAFEHNHDIHAISAARIYHVDLQDVTPEQRRRAKTANFGILYGISAFGLAERLNIPRDEAKTLINGYFATFPEVRHYIDRVVEQARRQGYVTTPLGRRRMLPDINSRNAVVRSFSERNAVNAPIQGAAADIIKRAMIAIHRRFAEEQLRSKMILQVHDELNFDVCPEELARVEQIVIDEMQAAYTGRVTLTASHAAAANWLDAH